MTARGGGQKSSIHRAAIVANPCRWGVHGGGTRVRRIRRSPPVSNPAAAMASTVRRFGSHPEASQDHGLAIRSWNRPIKPSPRTCSRTTSLPPGARTRRISARVASTSSTEHSTSPMCTESKLPSSKGIDSPIPSTMLASMLCRRASARPFDALPLRVPRRPPTSRPQEGTAGPFRVPGPPSVADRTCGSSPRVDSGDRTACRRPACRVDRCTGTTDYGAPWATCTLPRSIRNGGYSSRISET